MQPIGSVRVTLGRDHPGIITIKFGQNLIRDLQRTYLSENLDRGGHMNMGHYNIKFQVY